MGRLGAGRTLVGSLTGAEKSSLSIHPGPLELCSLNVNILGWELEVLPG